MHILSHQDSDLKDSSAGPLQRCTWTALDVVKRCYSRVWKFLLQKGRVWAEANPTVGTRTVLWWGRSGYHSTQVLCSFAWVLSPGLRRNVVRILGLRRDGEGSLFKFSLLDAPTGCEVRNRLANVKFSLLDSFGYLACSWSLQTTLWVANLAPPMSSTHFLDWLWMANLTPAGILYRFSCTGCAFDHVYCTGRALQWTLRSFV